MKIGILTHFHKSTNYGGVLQAYALCRYLNEQGHSALQILYTARVKKLDPSMRTVKTLYGTFFKRIKRKWYGNKNRAIKKRMEQLFFAFREQVPHTKNEYTKDDISDVRGEFDAVIAGSDQIWNPDWYDSSYMLDFVDASVPKISYAASMGVSFLTENQKNTYKKHLLDFKKISVREMEGANALADVLEREIEVCVDPTLLLSAEEWDKIAEKNKIQEKYIFLYMLGNDSKVNKLAQKFAALKGLKLICIPDLMGEYRAADRKIKAQLLLDAAPGDFISLIKHAEYVFTDSFHACVFSLLYQKEFFAFERRAAQKTNSRICNLIEIFECKERFCATDEERTIEYLTKCPPIDYFSEKPLFAAAKQRSVDFLNASVQLD